jgi:hypothetical protein
LTDPIALPWCQGRSPVAVEFLPPERDGDARALLTCDCGTATDLTVRFEGPVEGGTDAAFTCEGCATVHWFTVSVAGSGGPDADR